MSFKTWVEVLGKDSDAGRDWGQEEKGMTEDEMAGWYHWLDGRESGWTPGVGDGQGGLVCCDSWGCKELDMTERLNWTELNWGQILLVWITLTIWELTLTFNFVVVVQLCSDSLWPHGLQHARLPCPSLFPRVCSNSCPMSWWCHLTISSSVVTFSFSHFFSPLAWGFLKSLSHCWWC